MSDLEHRVRALETETSEQQEERLRLNDRTPEEIEADKKDSEEAAKAGKSLEDYRASKPAEHEPDDDGKKNKNRQHRTEKDQTQPEE